MNLKFVILALIVGFSIGVSVDFSTTQIAQDLSASFDVVNYDYISRVGCSSNSMGTTFHCGDILYKAEVDAVDNLTIGSIYVYQFGNITVVHRLVQCVDEDCNLTVFKGDNNYKAEFVNRSDILYKVVRVEYR